MKVLWGMILLLPRPRNKETCRRNVLDSVCSTPEIPLPSKFSLAVDIILDPEGELRLGLSSPVSEAIRNL